jgi:hypothetical protein
MANISHYQLNPEETHFIAFEIFYRCTPLNVSPQLSTWTSGILHHQYQEWYLPGCT